MAGRRTRRVAFERAEIERNELNEPVKTWKTHCVVWADREDVSDAELIAAGELGASLGARFTVARNVATTTLTPADRLFHDGAYWNILAVRERRDDPLRRLEVRAVREVA